jgi:cytochrome oxidase Cu insertion factor (SCO1/SenC/PrrC family)
VKKQIPIFLLGLAVLTTLSGCANPSETENRSKSDGGADDVTGYANLSKSVAVGKLAPDFEIKDQTGKTWRLSDYKGKTVMLDFWALW